MSLTRDNYFEIISNLFNPGLNTSNVAIWRNLRFSSRILKELVESITKDQINRCFRSNFFYSCKYGKPEEVAFFIKLGVNPGSLRQSGILKACEADNLPVIKELLKDSRVDPSANNNDLIITALSLGHQNIVEEILQTPRFDSSVGENYLFLYACEMGYIEFVKELLKTEKTDPSVEKCLSLIISCEYGRLEIVRELLKDPRIDPLVNGNFALEISNRKGFFGISELLEDAMEQCMVSKKRKLNKQYK